MSRIHRVLVASPLNLVVETVYYGPFLLLENGNLRISLPFLPSRFPCHFVLYVKNQLALGGKQGMGASKLEVQRGLRVEGRLSTTLRSFCMSMVYSRFCSSFRPIMLDVRR